MEGIKQNVILWARLTSGLRRMLNAVLRRKRPALDLAVQIEPHKSKLRKGWMEAEELAAKMRKYIEMGIGKTRH